jgi:hypothetical protein
LFRQGGILELFRQCSILELFRLCGILELFRKCGILELFRQCGILELFRQCGISLFFILLLLNVNVRTQQVPLLKQDSITLPDHLRLALVFSGVCVIQSLIL